MSGRMFQYIHLKYKLERVAKIPETLKKLGALQKEIEDVCSTIYDRVTNDHTRRILLSLKKANPEKEELFKGINDGKMDHWNKETIEKFINNQKLIESNETKETILDIDYFLENKKLRRENKWQS